MAEIEETKLKKAPSIIDDDKNTGLHYSAALGKQDELPNELEKTQKVDVENYLGWTPLMMACKNGHLNIVNLLLQHRADATKKNRFGMSVFLISITSGNMEIVHVILQHLLSGGVSRQSMQYILSPISVSILFCYQHILQYLIEQNFNVNSATPVTGITPLMFASAMENNEALALLLTKGAIATLRNSIGYTAHDITQLKNRKEESKPTEANQVLPVTALKSPYTHTLQHPIPCIVISPQPFIPFSVNDLHNMRKSSNTLSPSPNYFYTTPVTPIPPVHYMTQPQMFFPPEFSPSHYYTGSPISNLYNTSNDFLNNRVYLNNTLNNAYTSPLIQTQSFSS